MVKFGTFFFFTYLFEKMGERHKLWGGMGPRISREWICLVFKTIDGSSQFKYSYTSGTNLASRLRVKMCTGRVYMASIP